MRGLKLTDKALSERERIDNERRTFVYFHAFHGFVVNSPSALLNKLIAFDA